MSHSFRYKSGVDAMRSRCKMLVLLLVALLVAPSDTALASWMALGMASHSSIGEQAAADEHRSVTQHSHVSHTVDNPQPAQEMVQTTQSDRNSHHDEADCDEHCMNCSSHCFSPGLLTSASAAFLKSIQERHALPAQTLQRADGFFRPPISA